ncbi:MAG: recombinase RecA [Planctomycetes bacterium DG_58]|nr:MAG: recombinase RecA [Planctomycetes bacterium DG_58]
MARKKKGKEPVGGEGSLDRTVAQIQKQYGEGAIMKLGAEVAPYFDGISTGSLSLDLALGGTGVPRGCVCEIFGPEASGKTTLALQIVASAQRAGGVAAFIDVEHAVQPAYARSLGVDLEQLLINQPGCGEEALQVCELLVRSNAIDVIVIDSVAALVPRAELEGEMSDTQVGLQARLMSKALRKLTAAISKSKTTVLFINQIREKIGVMFGNPETTPGGRALKFYSWVRMDIRRTGALRSADQVVGNRTRVRVVKNKVAPPFRSAEFDLEYGKGISYVGDVLDMATELKLVERSGTWFSLGEERIGQGRERAKEFLRENPDVLEQMRKGVLEKLGYAELIEKLPPLAKPQDEQAESEEDTSEGAQET